MAITPAQCRAARAWLGWNQAELAAKASVGISTIRSLEDGTRTPIANNAVAIRRTLEDGGADFLLKATDGRAAPAEAKNGAAKPARGQEPGSARRRGTGGRAKRD